MRIQECANVALIVQYLLKRSMGVIMCIVSIVVQVFAGCVWHTLTRARSAMHIYSSPMVDLFEFMMCLIFV